MKNPARGARRQGGTVLVIGLVFLLLMTLVAVTSIQTTSLDEQMAGNARDRNLAFQSGEAALREADDRVEKEPTPSFKEMVTEVTPDPNSDSTWSGQQSYSEGIEYVAAPPIYVIELVADLSSALEFNDLGGLYRVTSRAQGSTASAVVVLQTNVGRGKVDE